MRWAKCTAICRVIVGRLDEHHTVADEYRPQARTKELHTTIRKTLSSDELVCPSGATSVVLVKLRVDLHSQTEQLACR